MIISPIIPIWIMIPIVIALIIIVKRNTKNKTNILTRLAITVLLFMINLRIMIPSSNVEVMTSNVDILFVIDNTISMAAEDYGNNTPRLTAMKKDCKYIMDELSGARFSIITFNNNSQILVPYTKDANMVANAIEGIHVADSFYAQGSSLNTPLEDMQKILKISDEKGGRRRIVFFISDGEITNEEKLKSFSSLNKYIEDGAVLRLWNYQRWKNESKRFVFRQRRIFRR